MLIAREFARDILARMPPSSRTPPPASMPPRSRTGASRHACRSLLPAIIAAALVAGCAGIGGETEMEVSKDTYACKLQGQRLVVRFTEQEARMLMPPDERLVTLYQVSSATSVRYTNGMMELRGAGTQLTLTRDNFSVALTDCEPLKVPKKSTNPFLLK
jgi:membrane-bound inhibitor of C-type lysozyme